MKQDTWPLCKTLSLGGWDRLKRWRRPETLALLLLCCGLWGMEPAQAEICQVRWEQLDLSQDQRVYLHSVDNQWKGVVTEALPRLQIKERKLKQMMSSPTPNEEAIMALQQQIHQDKARLKLEATQLFLHKRRVLTPEQQEKLRQMMAVPATAAPTKRDPH